MTELQDARAKWLAAESRCVDLQQEVERLRCANHELQMRLASAQCQATLMHGLATGYAKALLT